MSDRGWEKWPNDPKAEYQLAEKRKAECHDKTCKLSMKITSYAK